MKSYFVCALLCMFGFFAMGMQLGWFRPVSEPEIEEEAADSAEVVEGEEDQPPKAPKAPRARFPIDLAPAAKAQPVPAAAAYEPADRPHKMAFFRANGSLHEWHDNLEGYYPDWCPYSVDETELVLVIGGYRKIKLSYHTYPNGAPPVTRYQYNLEASVIEAKTGRVLAYRQFQNIPRPLRQREDWHLTIIGAPVSFRDVFRWASGIAKWGQPAVLETVPIIKIIGD
jgi:hypothetical protein